MRHARVHDNARAPCTHAELIEPDLLEQLHEDVELLQASAMHWGVVVEGAKVSTGGTTEGPPIRPPSTPPRVPAMPSW
jgi:hypothetical protein